MFRKSITFVLILIGSLVSAFGHEGHGILHGHEPGHYLLSPQHAIPILLGIVLVVLMVRRKAWSGNKK